MGLGKSRLAALAAAMSIWTVAGCKSSSPYDYMESWIIREDAARPFSIPADVIYVQSDLYESTANLPLLDSYARHEVGLKRFEGIARVFSPLVANAEDLEEAVEWYFGHHHEKKRPFVFIGEGAGGGLLREYEQAHREKLLEKGLVASFYTVKVRQGFVDGEMVKKIKRAVVKARYENVWERPMPERMLKE